MLLALLGCLWLNVNALTATRSGGLPASYYQDKYPAGRPPITETFSVVPPVFHKSESTAIQGLSILMPQAVGFDPTAWDSLMAQQNALTQSLLLRQPATLGSLPALELPELPELPDFDIAAALKVADGLQQFALNSMKGLNSALNIVNRVVGIIA